MFARASCEDGRPLCLFCILYALSRPPLPLYHESPFLLPVTGHRFHPLPIRMRQSCLPRRRWYNFAHFVIRDNIPRIRFLHHWRWPLSNEAKPSPKRCSNRGEKLHNRSKAVANLFEYLFEDVETVEIIPCFSRIRVRGSSKAKKQSPSIERRSDPTEDPSIPLNRNPVTRSKTEEILDVNKSDVEANVDCFAIRTFARRMLHGGRGTIDRSTFLSTNRRANETLVDRWSDRFDSIRTGYAITTRHMYRYHCHLYARFMLAYLTGDTLWVPIIR